MQLLTTDDLFMLRFAEWWEWTSRERTTVAGCLTFHLLALVGFSAEPVQPPLAFAVGAVAGVGSVAAWLLGRTASRRPLQGR